MRRRRPRARPTLITPSVPTTPSRKRQDYEASHYYASDIHQDGEAEDVYDDGQARRRRIGIVAIVAVFALAVIGTAGAFTYRAIYHTGASKPPPVIKADATPSKVVPEVKSKDPQSSKLIYDRVNDRAQPERIVSREEQPVEMKDKPSGVLPPSQNEHALGNGVVGAEPKKIHTIAIRPDHAGAAGSAPMRRGATAATAAGAQPAAVAAREPPAARPPTVTPPATRSAAAPAASRRRCRLTPTRPPPRRHAPRRRTARTAAVTPTPAGARAQQPSATAPMCRFPRSAAKPTRRPRSAACKPNIPPSLAASR